MNAIKNIFIALIGIVTQVCCSQEITANKINQPYNNYFKNKVKEIKKQYKDFPDVSNQVINNETYYYKRRIKLRNQILDSLNILKKDRIIIVDEFVDHNGERLESSYFIYNESLVLLSYKKDELEKKNYDKPLILKTTIDKLSEYNANGIETIYHYFNKNDLKEVNGPIEFKKFVTFNVTVVLNNEIGFYLIRSKEQGFEINKLQ